MPDGVFPLEVVTPEAALLDIAARSVVLRSSDGELTVLDGHTPLVTDIVPGVLRVETAEGDVLPLAEHGGFLYVDTSPGAAGTEPAADGAPAAGLTTRVTLLLGVAELAAEIDVDRARRARDEAQARLVELASGSGRGAADPESPDAANPEVVEAEAALRRAEVRLEAAGSTGD